MSELSDLKQVVEDLRDVVSTHITESKTFFAESHTYRKERDKVVDAHSSSLWGNGHPGLEKKVDRLEQIEVGRKWIIRALILATIGGITDAFFHIVRK